MGNIWDIARWAIRRRGEQEYWKLVKQLFPDYIELQDEPSLAAYVYKHAGLQPDQFKKLPYHERLPFLQMAVQSEGINESDWLPAELPSKCAKNLSMSLDTLQRRIKEKAVRVDVISQKSWRLHRVDAAKLGFSSQK